MKLDSKIILAFALVAPGSAVASGTDAFDEAMAPILKDYLAIHGALAGDKIEGVKRAATSIAATAKKLDPAGVEGEHAEHYRDLPAKLETAAAAVAAAVTVDEARAALKELSKPMAMWGTMSKPKGVVVMFCSMAKASWLQKKGDVENPYYGSKMLGCGEIVGGDTEGRGHRDPGHMKHGKQMTN
jgi:Cu(I)/Ag(I) efflux system membrane fusion protein